MPNERKASAGLSGTRQALGTHYNTPTGSMASSPSDGDRLSDNQSNDSKIQADRTKKLQMVTAELKRMRYF